MSPPDFSIVTTCKGRLQFLKQSLPTFVCQADTEVVVVDYDCPDRAKDWVATHFPDVRIAAVSGAPQFNVSRARNIGVSIARAPWLILCDADTLLAESFVQQMRRLAIPGNYLQSYVETPGGSRKLPFPLLCETTAYRAVGGYDDAFRGWGAEDWEFVSRLERHGLRETLFPATLAVTVRHSNESRSRHYEHEISVSMAINHHYAKIKERYFETRGRWFTDAQRYATYDRVNRAVLAALGDQRSNAVFDIAIDGASPPWTARLPAAAVRRYHEMAVEGLARVTL